MYTLLPKAKLKLPARLCVSSTTSFSLRKDNTFEPEADTVKLVFLNSMYTDVRVIESTGALQSKSFNLEVFVLAFSR